jgi:NTE family protein
VNKRDPAASRDARIAPASRAKSEFGSVALVLQGGGALGAYQAGVYERLLEEGIEPTWLSGISIGAINCAIIAGNARENRVARLREFWELVSDCDSVTPCAWTGVPMIDSLRAWVNQLAAGRAFVQGVNGFFEPRMPPPYLLWNGGGATSYYDTAPLRATLERLVDFDLINAGETRLSVGAVNVRTGNFAYFDNASPDLIIGPEHIMASGALPPGFDAVQIGKEKYWDGGMVSNTPLDWVLSNSSGLDTQVWQVDLWSAHGELPTDLASVATRMKEIQYSSRTRAATDSLRKVKKLRAALSELLAIIPAGIAASPQAQLLAGAADATLYNIIELVYRSATYEGQYKDVEFSRPTMNEHWQAGYADADATLAHEEIMKLPSIENNPAVFDFLTKPAQPT